MQCNITIEASKIWALISGEVDQYEFLAGKEILPFGQSRIIEQAKFTYSPLVKAFENK